MALQRNLERLAIGPSRGIDGSHDGGTEQQSRCQQPFPLAHRRGREAPRLAQHVILAEFDVDSGRCVFRYREQDCDIVSLLILLIRLARKILNFSTHPICMCCKWKLADRKTRSMEISRR